MSEESNIRIEGSTGVWEMRLEGAIQGTYSGVFRFKCFLSPTQKIAANREYRELLGSNPLTTPEHESYLAYALTQLKYRIVEAPPFWSSTKQSGSFEGDIPDSEIISAILDAAIETEVKYMKQLKQKKEDALKRAVKAAEAMISRKDEKSEADEDQDEADEE